MSRLSHWLAGWACVGMVFGPVMSGRAADPPAAAAAPFDFSYVPAVAVAAVVLHPHDALTGPDAEWLPVEVITAAGLKEFGFDPLKIKEAVVLSALILGSPDPQVGLILRFAEPY